MRRRTRIAMSVASGLAALAIALAYAGGVRGEVDRAREEALARYGGDLARVCVALRDIRPGEKLDEGNVAVREWVSSLLPQDAATSLDEVAGKVATAAIPAQSVVTPLHYESRESAVEVPEGMVAVSIASDEEHAVGGAIERGEQVDVYVSRDGVADRLCTAAVIDTSALAANGGDLTWVTLAIMPSQVEELLIAAGKATVTLVVPGEGAGEEANDAGEESGTSEKDGKASSTAREGASSKRGGGSGSAGDGEAKGAAESDAKEAARAAAKSGGSGSSPARGGGDR